MGPIREGPNCPEVHATIKMTSNQPVQQGIYYKSRVEVDLGVTKGPPSNHAGSRSRRGLGYKYEQTDKTRDDAISECFYGPHPSSSP